MKKTPHGIWRTLGLVLGAAALVALAFAPACSDDTPGSKPDGGDGPIVKADGPKDMPSSDVGDAHKSEGLVADLPKGDGPAGDGPAADGPGDDGPAPDGSGSCAGDGDSCRSTKCCKGLRCCNGIPLPAGVSRCLVTCPKSDRNLKRDFQSVDPDDVLRRLMTLPITRWSYKRDDPHVRHIGPMAQDFKRTFGVGSSDRYIAPLDGTGVSLAAIKALTRAVKRLEAAQKQAQAKNARLEAELRRLRRRIGQRAGAHE